MQFIGFSVGDEDAELNDAHTPVAPVAPRCPVAPGGP